MNLKKRIICLILSITMILGLLPVISLGAGEVTYEKATSLTAGEKYVITASGYGLNTTAHTGYVNGNGNAYAGLAGTAITVASDKITSTVTEDMIWTLETNNGGYSIKSNTGKYLTSYYTSSPTIEGGIKLADSSEKWTYTNSKLLGATSNKYFTFDVPTDINPSQGSTGEANLFTVRSSGDNITFYKVVVASEQEEPETTTGKYLIVFDGKNGDYALSSAETGSYTTSGGTYSGYKGVAYTEGTTTITEAMIWDVEITGDTRTIKQGDKYLKGNYGGTPTGTLELVDEKTEWTFSNDKLSLTISGTEYELAHSDGTSGVTGSPNVFSMRSSGKGQDVTFVKYTGTVPEEPATVEVQNISIKSSTTLTVGAQETLNVTFTPTDATDKTIIWTSSEPSVATVSSAGIVTALSAGTTTITAKSSNNKTATCAVTVNQPVDNTPVFIAVSSDMHNTATNATTDNTSAKRLNDWLNSVSGTIGADFETFVGCGDYAPGDGSATGVNYWTRAQVIMDVVKNNSHVKDNGTFIPGNHEWSDTQGGDYGVYKASNATAQALKLTGEIAKTDKYILYAFGASSASQGFNTDDISALDTYLGSAPAGVPIFVFAHYPLHSYNGRSSTNAANVISTLNKYSTKDIYYIWGHNHTLSDPNYDKVITDKIDNTDISFTYCAAGCMSDAENYTGSGASIKAKGLVIGIAGGEVSLSYYDKNFALLEGSDDPVAPTTGGKYLIIQNGYALSSAATGSYTTNGGNYSGLKGVKYTAGTTPVTTDMLWNISIDNDTYTIMQDGKYLAGTYEKPSDTATGTLTLTDTPTTWTLTSDNKLNIGSGYLLHSDGTSGVSGNPNVFSMRSSSNAKAVTFTEFTGTPSQPEIIEVSSVTLSKTSTTLSVGASETLTATVNPSNATDKTVTWSSSDSSVATVSGGKITAVKAGTTTITAKAGEKTATCTVTVQAVTFSKYLIIQNGYALSSAATGSYTTDGGNYSGLKGVKYTAGTTPVTADMLWDISIVGSTYTIMQNGKYLSGSYEKPSNTATGTLTLTDTPATWTLTSDNKLNIGSGYLLHSDGTSGVSGNPNVFSMRSSSNAKAVTLTKYTGELPETVLGDVSGDGLVDTDDAMLILRYDAGLLQTLDLVAGDVSGDGIVDTDDAMLILRYDAGLIQTFPAA